LGDSTNPSENCLQQYYSKIEDLDFVSEAQRRSIHTRGRKHRPMPWRRGWSSTKNNASARLQIRGDLYMQGIYSVLEGTDQRGSDITIELEWAHKLYSISRSSVCLERLESGRKRWWARTLGHCQTRMLCSIGWG